jgi:uncharacterized membrane protein YeaQ/YmgE (transglycosylase-associated protein family)
MATIPGLGLFSWLAAGLVAAALARWLPPRALAIGWGPTLTFGAVGGASGGLLATVLGFGGIESLDPAAALVAALVAALAVVLARLLARR